VSVGFDCQGIAPTVSNCVGSLVWCNLPSHQHNRGDVYKRHRGLKIFFLGPTGFSWENGHIEKKIFGWYYKTSVTLG